MTVEETKHLVRTYFHRLLNDKDLAVCDELLAPDYIDHDAGPNASPGPGPTKAWVADFLREFPDMSVDIEDILAEGDRVAVRLVWNGIHGHTGERYHKTGIVILRIDERGRMAERWSAYE